MGITIKNIKTVEDLKDYVTHFIYKIKTDFEDPAKDDNVPEKDIPTLFSGLPIYEDLKGKEIHRYSIYPSNYSWRSDKPPVIDTYMTYIAMFGSLKVS